MNNPKANDNLTLVGFAFHQFLKNDICPKSSSMLLKAHYLNGWTEQQQEVADLIFSLLCSQTLQELIDAVDSGFTKTTPYSESLVSKAS